MDSLQNWIVPFTFIPGVGMLILSTSNRYYHVKDLIRDSILDEKKKKLWSFDELMKRARLFHHALVALYVAIGSFSLAALSANIQQNWFKVHHNIAMAITDALTLSGVFCVVLASSVLIREATLSLRHLEATQDPS